jgi:TolB-like protein/tetratricopeptide (TPR) repeat protein
MMGGVGRFLAELRRRKVYRVAVVYAAVAFVVWQVADIAVPSLGLPDSAVGAVLIFTVLGFPVALVLAWAYEVRPEEPSPTAVHAEEEPHVASPDEAFRTNSVAILPFENISPEKEDEYFADGIAEEITNVLAGLADLHVAARTSAFAFKGQHADIREIGRRLSVSYLVEGSVRRAGDTLRITAQLVDTTTGYHVWSERFDRAAGDVFEIQDEIAGEVARRLSEHVKHSGGSPRPVARSSHMPAYESYLKGRQMMAQFEGDAVVEAAALFEECIALDPDFAAARAGLAEALTLQSIGFQVRPGRETMPRALEEADVALSLDSDLPEAHLARALVAMFHEWDYGAAKAAFDRAEGLGPNVARVQMWREFYFTYVEHDFDAALGANMRAQQLSPLDPGPRSREATVRYLFDDLDGAERLFRAMLAEAPGVSVLHTGLADTLVRQGKIDEAVASMERAVEVGGPMVAWLGILGAFYGLQGSPEKGRSALQQLEVRSSQGYVSHFWIAVAHAGLGELDAAFSSLEDARLDRDSNLLYVFFVPRAMGLQGDSRFPGVLRSIGLAHLIPLL